MAKRRKWDAANQEFVYYMEVPTGIPEYGITYKHKTSMYWAIRSVLPEFGYEPVAKDGTVYGKHVVCLPDVVDKVCAKRRADYISESNRAGRKLPIWC